MLRNRNFTTLLAGQLVSSFGDNLYGMALPWYVYSLTGSKTDLAMSGVAVYLPMIAGLFVGVLVDRWKKRLTMIGADVIRGTISVIMVLAVIWKWKFEWLLLLVGLLELCGAFFSPAASALLPLVVSKEELPAAMGLRQSSNSLAGLAGMVSGGGLLALLGPSLLFLSNGVSYGLSILSLFLIKLREVSPNRSSRSSLFGDWRNGFSLIVHSKATLRIILSAIITNFGMAPIFILQTAWVKGPVHGNSITMGLVGASIMLGMFLGGFTVQFFTKRMSRNTLLGVGVVGIGCGTAAFIAIPAAWWVIIVNFMTGWMAATVNSALSLTMVEVVPQHMRGRIFGIFNSLLVLSCPLGIAVFGTLMTLLPLWQLFVIIACLSALGGLTYCLPIQNDLETLAEVTV